MGLKYFRKVQIPYLIHLNLQLIIKSKLLRAVWVWSFLKYLWIIVIELKITIFYLIDIYTWRKGQRSTRFASFNRQKTIAIKKKTLNNIFSLTRHIYSNILEAQINMTKWTYIYYFPFLPFFRPFPFFPFPEKWNGKSDKLQRYVS